MACWTRILVASRTRSWPCTTRETVAVETPARRATSKRVTTLSRSQALLGPQIPGPSADIQASHKRHVNVYTGNLSAYTNPQHRTGQGPCPRRNKGEVDDGTGGGRRRRTGLPGRVHLGSVNGRLPDRGAAAADGRGPSVWDTFSRTPGKVRGGDTGDIACDSYRRYPEDADLLGSLGLSSYRFSISWPRIFPDGAGRLNQAGLDHYKALLDALAERGISGAATLFHWDLPQALQDQGGWASRDIALRFANYAAVVGEALGDRV